MRWQQVEAAIRSPVSTHTSEELASLYRQGYPRGDEHMIAEPMGQMWLWTSIADMLHEEEPTYFDDFWSEPGYVGHDFPESVANDLIDVELTVTRPLTVKDLLEDPEFATPAYARVQRMAGLMGAASAGGDLPMAVQVHGIPPGYRLGAAFRLTSGNAAGRQLYCMSFAEDVFFCDGRGDANLLRFTGVEPGDGIHVDNRKFLAFCYFARHHVMDDVQFDSLRMDGKPVYRQHTVPVMSPLMGNSYSGQFEGKLLWVHHTHDASLWPPQGVIYEGAVLGAQGADGAAERFRLRWSENAEHVPPMMISPSLGRAANTWLIDYAPIIEQSLADLTEWVEQGVAPASTSYTYRDGKVTLPASAAERGGIQPVVAASANGATCAQVKAGETVALEVRAEVPHGGGTIISAQWDFDGTGSFPFHHDEVDGSASEVKLSTTHTYDAPGTYFATALVHSHRDGDAAATSRRIPNLGQVRIVVT